MGKLLNIIIFNLLPVEIKLQPNKEITSDILFKNIKNKDIWHSSLEEIKINNPELLKNKEKIFVVSFNVGRAGSNFYIKKLSLKAKNKANYVSNEEIEFINNYKKSKFPFEILI